MIQMPWLQARSLKCPYIPALLDLCVDCLSCSTETEVGAVAMLEGTAPSPAQALFAEPGSFCRPLLISQCAEVHESWFRFLPTLIPRS